MHRLLPLLIMLLFACTEKSEPIPAWQVSTGANLRFDIRLDSQIYRLSNFGEPPQMAIWMENETSGDVRTLWVTSRMATGVWVGKVVCPTALPYWVSRREIETDGSIPSYLKPLPDGITGATPKEDLTIFTRVDSATTWSYYLELNVSGDYNVDFPASMPNGTPDPDGNGQPSLIYGGTITVEPGASSTGNYLGMTDQWRAVDEIDTMRSGLTTADKVLQDFHVRYIP